MMKSNLNCDHQLVFYETSITLEFFALGSTGDEAHLHTEAENAIFNGNDSFFFGTTRSISDCFFRDLD